MSDPGNKGRKGGGLIPYRKRVEPKIEAPKVGPSKVEVSPPKRVVSTTHMSPLESMTEWARKIHASAPKDANIEALEKEGKRQYVAMTPQPKLPQLSRSESVKHMGHLEDLHSSKDTTFSIASQSQDKMKPEKRDSPSEYLARKKDKALDAFAYRFRPTPSRPKDPSGKSGRITVNLNPEHSKEVATALGNVLDDTVNNPTVTGMKMMGPNHFGQRVDDSVMYLAGHDPESARKTAGNITKELKGTPGALVDHTPPGMEHISTGLSYAETKPGDSTSHGTARRVILAKAVDQFRTNTTAFPKQEQSMEAHVQTAAFKAGYNPNMPSRVIAPERGALMKQIGTIGKDSTDKASAITKRVNKSK